jgi:sodium-dependent dicarboxylate transporter 2/3/5
MAETTKRIAGRYDPAMAEPAPARVSEAEARFDRVRRRIGRWAAPAALLLVLAAPLDLAPREHRMAAVAIMTVILWITEAVPLAVAALSGPAIAVLLGVASAPAAFAPFAHPLIFLFLGGFVLAQALAHQGFDRRATLWLLSRPLVKSSPTRALVTVAATTWALSMWVSNTATTAMMLPIALGLCRTIERLCGDDGGARHRMQHFSEGLLLAVAYAASLGGTATPVGTATNLIAIELLAQNVGVQLDFLTWMAFGIPVSAVGLVAMLALAVRRFPPPIATVTGLTDHVREDLARMGPMSSGERRVVAVFLLAIAGWLAPAVLRLGLGESHPAAAWAHDALDEAVVALVCTGLLFVVPAGRGPDGAEAPRLITWARAIDIDWGTLFLLGGGFALSQLVFETGLAESIADAVLGGEALFPHGELVLLVLATTLVIYMTELSSNTATINMFLPVIIPIALAAGFDPLPIVVTVTLAGSYAFMLPVSTPPNAIVYGTGRVRIDSMIRFGAWLNVVGLVLLIAVGALLLPRMALW